MAQIAFTGNAGKDPEIRFFDDGTANTRCTVAESHSRFNRDTQQWDEYGTTWHNITLRGKRAESFAQHVTKGTRVTITGKQQSRTYEKDGESRSFLEVLVDDYGVVPRAEQAQPRPAGQGEQWTSQQPPQQPTQDPWAGQQSGYDTDQVPF